MIGVSVSFLCPKGCGLIGVSLLVGSQALGMQLCCQKVCTLHTDLLCTASKCCGCGCDSVPKGSQEVLNRRCISVLPERMWLWMSAYRGEKLWAADISVQVIIKPLHRSLQAIPELLVSTAFGTFTALFALAYPHGNKAVGVIIHFCQITHCVSICAIPLRSSR